MPRVGVLSAEELAAISKGALPSAARRRLEELAGIDGMSSSFFSASADGLAADLDIVALGQVVGCCAAWLREGVLRAVGPGAPDWRRPGDARWLERSGITESWTRARRRATSRLRDQAKILNADAVLGVVASRRQFEFVGEVVLSGTAVRMRRPTARADGEMLVSTVSLAELLKLRATGAEPVGLVGGCASLAASPSSATRRALRRRRRARESLELGEFTFAFSEARRRGVERLRAEAGALGCDGVIGVELEDLQAFRAGGGAYHVVLHLLGTAVTHEAPAQRPAVSARLRLDGRAP